MTKRKWVLLAFIVAFVPKLIMSMFLFPYSIFDECGTVASAAYMAGYDWSAVLAKSSAYFGFGYYILFTPVFLITDNPYIIYKIIVCGNVFLHALSAVLSFQVMEYIFPEIDYKKKCVFSIMLSYLTVVTTVAMNETPVIFLVWVCVLLGVKIICENTGKRNLHILFLELMLAWGLTIHTRLILLPIVIVFFSALYRMIWKQKFLSWFDFFCLSGLCILSRYVVKIFQKQLWVSNGTEGLKNASIDAGAFITRFDFTDIETWDVFCKIFVGQIGTATVFSGGLFLVCLFALVFYFVRMIRDRQLGQIKNKIIFMVFGICIICILSTVAGQMITWGNQTLEAINNNKEGHEIYKVFTYIRYFAPYMGPLILCGLGIINDNNEMVKKLVPYIVSAFICLEYIWIKLVLPYVEEVNLAGEEFMFFANRRPRERVNYYYAFIWLNTFLFVFIYCVYKNITIRYIYIVCIMLVLNFGYKVYFCNRAYAIEKTNGIPCCYELVKKIENELNIENLKIYAEGYDSLRLQFYLNRYPIHSIGEVEGKNNNLIFYQGTIDQEILRELEQYDISWFCANIDEQGYVIVSKDVAVKMVDNMNLVFEELK